MLINIINATENEERTEMSFNLKDIFSSFFKHLWIIILSSFLCLGASIGIVGLTTDQEYCATAKIFINNKGASSGSISEVVSNVISSADINASSSLVPTYSELSKSFKGMLEDVVKEYYGLTDTEEIFEKYKEIKEMLNCASVSDTSILKVSITSNDAQEAIDLVNRIVDKLPDKVELTIDGSNVTTVDKAYVADPVSRGFTKWAIIGFLIGLVGSCLVIFIFDVLLNDSIDSSEWLIERFGKEIPLLSIVPDMDEKHSRSGYYEYHYESSKEESKEESK